MSETPTPDAAVDIAREALVKLAVLERHGDLAARVAVAALADAGWLHDPERVEELEILACCCEDMAGRCWVHHPGECEGCGGLSPGAEVKEES